MHPEEKLTLGPRGTAHFAPYRQSYKSIWSHEISCYIQWCE